VIGTGHHRLAVGTIGGASSAVPHARKGADLWRERPNSRWFGDSVIHARLSDVAALGYAANTSIVMKVQRQGVLRCELGTGP
jgi:hypothetical protein